MEKCIGGNNFTPLHMPNAQQHRGGKDTIFSVEKGVFGEKNSHFSPRLDFLSLRRHLFSESPERERERVSALSGGRGGDKQKQRGRPRAPRSKNGLALLVVALVRSIKGEHSQLQELALIFFATG